MINGEYFFRIDNGFGNCSSITFTTPAADGSFSFNIPISQIPAGADTLFVRVRDDIENRWSITKFFVSPSGSLLPLTLLDFTVTKNGNIAQLKWQTANEVNTSHFDIERSTDGVNFTAIGKVDAAGNSFDQRTILLMMMFPACQQARFIIVCKW